ncbi:MAG: EAL domain-containing protein [Cyanophyceae cyanobacterium]
MAQAGTILTETYDPRLVILSVAIAVFGSYIALDLAEQIIGSQRRKYWLLGGALTLGISIWAQHFVAMLAYRLSIPIAYNFPVVLVAMAVSVAGAGAGLYVVTRQHPLTSQSLLLGALLVGLGIVGLHLTAMEAVRVNAIAYYDPQWMTLSVVTAVGFSGGALGIAFHQRSEQLMHEIVRKVSSMSLMAAAIVGMHYLAMAAVDYRPIQSVALQQPPGTNHARLAVMIGAAALVILFLTLLASFFGQRSTASRATAIAQGQSEERFRALVQNASDIVAIVAADGTINYLSPATETILQHKPEKWLGKQADLLIHPDDISQAKRFWEQVLAKAADTNLTQELRLRHRDRSWRHFEIVAKNLLTNNVVEGIVATCRDITERKRSEKELQQSQEKYRALYDNAPDAYFSIAPDGTIVSVNQFGAAYLGYSKAELLGQSALMTVYEPDREWVQQWLEATFTKRQLFCEQELRKRHKNGSALWIRQRSQLLLNDEGEPVELYIIGRDITEQKQAEQQLFQNAFYDALTKLPNRALFTDRLNQALERSQRQENYLFAVLFLDLDRFKVINDSLGHTTGDWLLIAIARRLEQCLRPIDTAARLGGDEFTVLLEDIRDASDAIRVAERIQEEISSPFVLNGQEVFTGTSIGIALNTSNYSQAADLLRDADIAMYRAKERGKGRYEMFNDGMLARAVERLQLETDLRRAVEQEEFELYYQPVVSMTTGTLNGFEALLRWQHPQRGLLEPEEFLAVAQETELMTGIGRWTIQQTCRQLQEWQHGTSLPLASRALAVSVNLCNGQFQQLNLIEEVQRVLQETQIDSQCLKLEITEKEIMSSDRAVSTMSGLRKLGVELYIDNFGTGYSSLGCLHRFPINGFKIDRSFISRIESDRSNLKIIETIMALAQKLAITVIAEGVETAEQFDRLKQLQCSYAQGRFFSQPLDSQEAAALIANEPRW